MLVYEHSGLGLRAGDIVKWTGYGYFSDEINPAIVLEMEPGDLTHSIWVSLMNPAGASVRIYLTGSTNPLNYLDPWKRARLQFENLSEKTRLEK